MFDRRLAAIVIGFGLLLVQSLLGPRPVAAQKDPPGRKLAFLVGVKVYNHADLKNLEYPERDVEELAAVLGAGGFRSVVLTTERGNKDPQDKPTAENIRTRLNALLRGATKHDLIIVGLAGHGIQPLGSADSFFCPTDASPVIKDERPVEPKSLISLSELLGQMSDSGIGHKLLLVDACRNDPSARSARHRGVDHVNGAALPPQTGVLLSCSEGEYSFEDKSLGGGHGIFFYHVIEGLRGAAQGDDRDVTWDELGLYVRRKVPATVERLFGKDGGEQSPNAIENLHGAPAALVHLRNLRPKQNGLLPKQNGPVNRESTTLARITAGGGFDSQPSTVTPPSTTQPITKMPAPVKRVPRMLLAPFSRERAQKARAAWAFYRKVPEEQRNSVGMDLLLIPPGQFAMGSYETPDDLKRQFPETQFTIYIRERPVHAVTITRPFFLSRYEVTKGQFKKFVDATAYKTNAERDPKGGWGYTGDPHKPIQRQPRFNWRNWGVDQRDDSPVVNVSWFDAMRYCRWLSKQEGKKYRLPTEAEWEYACRAGSTSRYYNGNDPEGLTRIANVRDAALKRAIPGWTHGLRASDGWAFTSPVGQFAPNNFGLYDMLGNASEWCSDWFDESYYSNSPQSDPTGPAVGTKRVARGEGWHAKPVDCRPARRLDHLPAHHDAFTGFRLVCEP